ncbi:MAG TPA: nitrous oxide reductase accessory protein NosL [Cyclobacteriaceae bacterium]|nr:nitrous oxide reductase accessory protein NosL [Cyclobacteriaceae bacterium]HRJ82852.1 nitrous oxide reductase accessory protein NosL [Cyclobacteriaceae bacterium]
MRVLLWLSLFLALASCSVKPEPILYGKDNCHLCKMTIMDRRFGAEVVTAKGKIYKFDDVNCMINFLNSGYLVDREVAHKLVIDFSQPEKLIEAPLAFFIKSSEIKSPMASQIASFETDELKNQYNQQWKGIYLTWGELTTQFK